MMLMGGLCRALTLGLPRLELWRLVRRLMLSAIVTVITTTVIIITVIMVVGTIVHRTIVLHTVGHIVVIDNLLAS